MLFVCVLFCVDEIYVIIVFLSVCLTECEFFFFQYSNVTFISLSGVTGKIFSIKNNEIGIKRRLVRLLVMIFKRK